MNACLLFWSVLTLSFCCAVANVIAKKSYTSMSDCEYSLHTKCVIGQLKSKKLTEECDASDLLECLKKHVTDELCSISDPKTLSTIRSLIDQVMKRFKIKKLCANKRFLNNMEDHFLVQGEKVGTDQGKETDMASSGSGEVPDDNEPDDDAGEEEKGKKESKETSDVDFWKENAKKMSWKHVPLLVYFDDPKQYKKNKLKEKNKTVSKPVQKAWENLKKEYQNWFKSSKYYAV